MPVDAFGDGDMPIGMDIISKGDFAVSNFEGKTWFAFQTPSQGHIDFGNAITEEMAKNLRSWFGENPND